MLSIIVFITILKKAATGHDPKSILFFLIKSNLVEVLVLYFQTAPCRLRSPSSPFEARNHHLQKAAVCCPGVDSDIYFDTRPKKSSL